MGVLAGATSAAFGVADKIPADELARKTIVTGSIAGLSAAAAGGEEKAVKEAFIGAAGTTVLQTASGQVRDALPQAESPSGKFAQAVIADGATRALGAAASSGDVKQAFVDAARGTTLQSAAKNIHGAVPEAGSPAVDLTQKVIANGATHALGAVAGDVKAGFLDSVTKKFLQSASVAAEPDE
jgi:hypothetical protein